MSAGADDPHIGLVVEGNGDRGAFPLLLRKQLESREDFRDIIGKPIPLHGKGAATKEGGIERYVQTAALRPGCRGVIVLLDADKESACIEGPALLKRAESVVAVPVVIVLAERDYEDWIYASAETLDLNLEYTDGRNGGKALEEALAPRTYIKPTWQPRLTSRMSLPLVSSRSTSFARMLKKFDELCGAL